MATRFVIQIVQGESLARFRFVVRTSTGAPANLTGYTAKLQARKAPGAAAVLDLSTTNGRLVIDGPAGTIALVKPASETYLTAPDRYAAQLFLDNGSGDRRAPYDGEYIVKATVVDYP